MQLKQRAVVDIGNVDGVHTFLCVLLELKFKHVLVEKVLQLLVGQVDAPLLKAVVGLAIIVGGIVVIIKDEPAAPTGDINSIEPLPEQDNPDR